MASETMTGQKRKRSEPYAGRKSTNKPRKFKKQTFYHSSSEDEDTPVRRERIVRSQVKEDDVTADIHLPDVTTNGDAVEAISDGGAIDGPASELESDDEKENAAQVVEGDDDPSVLEEDSEEDPDSSHGEDDSSESDVETASASTATRALRKRNDPTAFAASISKILGSKLTSSKRADPVLSRSVAASATSKELSEGKLEARARKKMRADKVALLEKGRVRDVLGLERVNAPAEDEPGATTGEIVEKERQLKKTAQRGVVKLFNAVRAAQMKGFEAENQMRMEGKIGIDGRKERVNEMSKKGFLDLITGSAS